MTIKTLIDALKEDANSINYIRFISGNNYLSEGWHLKSPWNSDKQIPQIIKSYHKKRVRGFYVHETGVCDVYYK